MCTPAKAAQVMFSQYLDSRLSGSEPRVRVVALHPGVVYTDLYSQVGEYILAISPPPLSWCVGGGVS